MKTSSLYLHIPFCRHLCFYCDFCKVFYDSKTVDQYLMVLKNELTALKIHAPLKTIYIGGGTPSCLNYQQLNDLMAMIKPYINSDTIEICLEVNPETIDETKMQILAQGGINRLSIGVETFNHDLLKLINRQHNNQQVFNVIELARKNQINNISIDLMYGLPGQTINDIEIDLDILNSLDVNHVSYYSLILEDHTVLKNQNYQLLDENQELIINQLIDKRLKQMGYDKYEISNYAKKGYESKHNLVYWHYDNYYGIGLGASGKIDDRLYEHSRNLTKYLNNQNTITETRFTKEETMFNHLMMSLRLVDGLDLKEFEQRYGFSIFNIYLKPLSKHLGLKTLVIKDNHLRCSNDSLYLLNEILMDFI